MKETKNQAKKIKVKKYGCISSTQEYAEKMKPYGEDVIITADRLRVADKCHTPVFHLADLISEIQDLLFHDCLQAEMAWDD